MNFGKELKLCLGQITHPLVPTLRLAQTTVDYLEVEKTGNNINLSFLDAKRKTKVGSWEYFNSTLRQSGKIGRILKKVLPTATDDEIRTLVESIQAELTKSEVNLFVVTGEHVRTVYQIPKNECASYSSMSGSCYQGIVLNDEFEFAERNPEIVKCLVATTNDNKLAGRAMFVCGKMNTEDAIWVEGIRGTEKATTLMKKYFKTLGIKNNYSHDSSSFGKFKADIVPGKVLHHISIGVSDDGKTLTAGYYNRGNDTWYKGTSYSSNHTPPINPDAFKQLPIPEKFIKI